VVEKAMLPLQMPIVPARQIILSLKSNYITKVNVPEDLKKWPSVKVDLFSAIPTHSPHLPSEGG
jgi:hypothetical protein